MGRRCAPSSGLGPWPKALARGHSLAPGKCEIGVPGGACPAGACPIPARWATPTSNSRKYRVPTTAPVYGAGRRDPFLMGRRRAPSRVWAPGPNPWPGAIHLPRASVESGPPAGRAPLGPAPSPHGGQRRLLIGNIGSRRPLPYMGQDVGTHFQWGGAVRRQVVWAHGPKPWPGAIHLPRASVRSGSPAGRAPLGPASSPYGGQRRLLRLKRPRYPLRIPGPFLVSCPERKAVCRPGFLLLRAPLWMRKVGQIEAKISGQCKQTRQAESRQH